jgi:mannose-6-phosphate isomerase-like protein (cupin superfamily)
MTPSSIHADRERRAAATAAPVSHGAALTFEALSPHDVGGAPLRLRPDEATLVRVISGVVRLTMGNVERLLSAGDEAIVRAGEPHRIAAVGGEARTVTGFRAAPLS